MLSVAQGESESVRADDHARAAFLSGESRLLQSPIDVLVAMTVARVEELCSAPFCCEAEPLFDGMSRYDSVKRSASRFEGPRLLASTNSSRWPQRLAVDEASLTLECFISHFEDLSMCLQTGI